MNMKFLILGLFFCFHSMAAVQEVERDLPQDPVLSLKAQEDLFVKAYAEVGPATLHPTKTPVPGLAPMTRMHFSYVREFLEKNSPDHLKVLSEIWQHTSRIIKKNELTTARMKMTALQLAVLLSEAQGTSEIDRITWRLIPSEEGNVDAWKNIKFLQEGGLYMGVSDRVNVINSDNYEDFGISLEDFWGTKDKELRHGQGFCEAILCCPTGGFSYDRFVKNFIDREFPLKISALSFNLDKGRVHGGNITQSVDFLSHDFTHTNEFLDHLFSEEHQVKKHPQVLEQYPLLRELGPWVVERDIFRKVYASPHNPERNKMALFLMLHENHPSIINFRSWLGGESLPFCERRLFWNLVANAINWANHLEDFLIDEIVARHKKIFSVPDSPLRLLLKIESIKVEQGHTHLKVRFDCQNDHDYSAVGKQSLNSRIGTFSFDIAYLQGLVDVYRDASGVPSKEMGELELISNISGIAWNDRDNILTEVQKQEIESKMKENFSHQEGGGRLYPRDDYYRQFIMDDEGKIKDVYGEGFLPPETAPLEERAWAMDQAMKKFWIDFYLDNKELFSVEPY